MKKYLVIGNPIEHSLSPKLHNHWIKKNNINAVYDKKQINKVDIKEITDFLNGTVTFIPKIFSFLTSKITSFIFSSLSFFLS